MRDWRRMVLYLFDSSQVKRPVMKVLQELVFSVVDVWDTLMRNQPYRLAWSEADATSHIRAQSGSDFDPQIIVAFGFLQDGRNRTVSVDNDKI